MPGQFFEDNLYTEFRRAALSSVDVRAIDATESVAALGSVDAGDKLETAAFASVDVRGGDGSEVVVLVDILETETDDLRQ